MKANRLHHTHEQFHGIRPNVCRIEPEDFSYDRNIFRIGSYQRTLAARTQRSITKPQECHSVVIAHMFDHMAAEYAAKLPRALAQIFVGFLAINGKAPGLASSD